MLIEDNESFGDIICQHLAGSRFEIRRSRSALEGLGLATELLPDLVLIGWRENEWAKLQVCLGLRETSKTAQLPIIILGPNERQYNRRLAWEAGADDYVGTTISRSELATRIDIVLRGGGSEEAKGLLTYADIEMDLYSYRVRRGGVAISLTAIQFKLLRHFLEHPQKVFSRKQLIEQVWGVGAADIKEATVNVCVRRLRQALDSAGGPELIRSVRGIGYALDG